ncbi:MAG: hypothetical protein ACHRXM_28855 [Isosphaerales bacterium]
MPHWRWRPTGLVPGLVLVSLAAVCFGRLAAHPSALIVDGRRPSIDHANPGEPRPPGNDLTFLFLPHHLSIIRVIAEFGHLPLWDARGFGGRPMVGNPQSGMFYPPVWAVWWSGAPAALGWLTIGHLLWGGLGVYVLMRSAGTCRWAATVAAGAYQASPFLLAHTFEGHYPHVWAACWYPWAFWAYTEVRSARLRGLLVMPIALALTYLTGHPQEWLLLLLALSVWTLSDALAVWRAQGPRRALIKLLVWIGLAAFSIGLAALEVVPELAVRPWLLRSHEPLAAVEMPRRYHLQALNGFQLFSPDALGDPSTYFGADNYWETLFSLGLAPLVLGVIAALRHPDRGLVRGWLALAGLAVWFACGRHLAFFAIVYSLVPGMNCFRVPARSLFLAALGGAVLCGLGVETLRIRMTGPLGWRRCALRCAGIMFLVLLSLFWIAHGVESGGSSRASEAARRVLGDGCFWFTLSGMTALLFVGSLPLSTRRPRLASGLFGLLALVELGWQGYAHLPIGPAERFLGVDRTGDTLLRLHKDPPCTGPLRIKARDSFFGDLPAAARGIEKTNVNDVFQLDHAARLYETLYTVASRPRRRRDGSMDNAVDDYLRQVRQTVFDRMSVSFLVSDRVESDPGWPVAARGDWHGAPFVIERNRTALPRAYVVPSAAVTPEDETSVLAHFRKTDPRISVLMSADPLSVLPPGPRQPFTSAAWVSTDPDHPLLQVKTEAPGLLVVTDTWLPGWTARVDGALTPVLRGNHAQQVIPVYRPGRHTIALDYQPPGFALGCAITALSTLGWVLMWGLWMWTGRAEQRRASAQTQAKRGPIRWRRADSLELGWGADRPLAGERGQG